jgi:hypothetical protein
MPGWDLKGREGNIPLHAVRSYCQKRVVTEETQIPCDMTFYPG